MNEFKSKDDYKKNYRNQVKRDIICKLITVCAIFAWILIMLALLLWQSAEPAFLTVFNEYSHDQLTVTWDFFLLRISFLLMIITLLFCIIGVWFNAMRMKRSYDKLNKSNIFIGIFTLIAIIYFWSEFNAYL